MNAVGVTAVGAHHLDLADVAALHRRGQETAADVANLARGARCNRPDRANDAMSNQMKPI